MKAKKNNEALTRTSAFREDRKNYLTEDGYTYRRWDEDLKKEVPVHIGLGEEYTDPDGTVRTIDREILIMVDSIDHAEDVEQDEYERHMDKVFSDKVARYEHSGKSGEDAANPWDEIPAEGSDPFALLFPEDAPMDEKIQNILGFMEGLTEAQRDLMFCSILQNRPTDLPEKMVCGYMGFLFRDKNGMPEVAMHWEHRFNHAVHRYNEIFRIQMPNITPHVCRHTYCSNQARAGMNPKTLQYLMGHSEIGVTMNTYTHLGLDDAKDEMIRLEELEQARKEIDKTNGEKPMKQIMFKAI